ncbi:MAG: aminotransferase class IV [Phocaeicola sp.]
MFLFLESIRIEGGIAYNLSHHEARMRRTLMQLGPLEWEPSLEQIVRWADIDQRTKCRVIYNMHGVEEVSYTPYAIRPIQTLQLIEAADLNYSLKSLNREGLNSLFQQRGRGDEVLITQKGSLTDTSIANVALYNGREWITPLHPLLVGTKRTELLERKLISEGIIRIEDLSKYSSIRCFNALIEWGECELPVTNLFNDSH